jgi:5'-phosphate synthase pdxT subunit
LSAQRRVGVLALQGDFAEHAAALAGLGVTVHEVRTPAQLAEVDGLIIPGGESTAMAKLMDFYGLREPLIAYGKTGRPVWGCCAGLILMADRLIEDRPEPLGLMEMLVHRNAFGRQVDSFETDLAVEGVEGGPFHAVFIRAPEVCEMGPKARVLASLDDGTIVAVQQGRMLATAFHPELTDDVRLHRYFVRLVEESVA